MQMPLRTLLPESCFIFNKEAVFKIDHVYSLVMGDNDKHQNVSNYGHFDTVFRIIFTYSKDEA